MNPVIRMAAETTQHGWILGATTIVFVTCFVGWVLWVYRPADRTAWEQAGRMPLDDGGAR